MLLLAALAGCAPQRDTRRSVQLVGIPDPTAAPIQPSSLHAAGPWYERRGSYDADGPAERPVERWRVPLGQPILEALTTDGQTLYAVSDGRVHAIDASGHLLWASESRAVGPVATLQVGPAVATADGVVLALDPSTGRHQTAWVSGKVLGLAVPLDGDIAWITEAGALMGGEGWSVAAPEGDRGQGGPASNGREVAWSTRDGALVVANRSGIRWTASLPGPGVGHPAIDGELLVTAYGAGQGHAGGVAAFNLKDGQELWRWPLGLEPSASPALSRVVLVPDLGGDLHALDRSTGALLWKTSGEAAWSSTPAIGRRGAFATEVHGRVSRLDLDDGGEVWSLDLASAIAADPVLVGDLLIVGLANGDVVALGPRPTRAVSP